MTERGLRVLVVEDDKNFRDLLDVVLGLDDDIEEVMTVEDGAHALSVCADFNPDVVVIDLMLPSMPGEEIGARIRDSHPGVKLISLSGMEAEHAGWADVHVVKATTALEDLRRAIGPAEKLS